MMKPHHLPVRRLEAGKKAEQMMGSETDDEVGTQLAQRWQV